MKISKNTLFNLIYFITLTLLYIVRWIIHSRLINQNMYASGESIVTSVIIWILIPCISAGLYPMLYLLLIEKKLLFFNGFKAVFALNTLSYIVPGLTNIYENLINGLALPAIVLFTLLSLLSYTVSFFIIKITNTSIKTQIK